MALYVYSFGLLVGIFSLIFPQKFWEWFYLGVRAYNKGILNKKWRLMIRIFGLVVLSISLIRIRARQ
ncbi:hypothetical protein VK70_21105 [Paenibacillus durus ATCC 35681]|uniref:Uncharacterized protein n=1 Tax=Paenibacillus durus ATCC 35681 TaxID=1333534 RepID=A0A0F7FDY0_PAEDU|nr:hypothetical protein VK70_21105 [Paenibacillus durus ATCC 35681]